MNNSFYLDPESVWTSCMAYISRLEEGNESLKEAQDAILLALGDNVSISGESLIACQAQLTAYHDIISAVMTINCLEIEESRCLSSSVGDEILDGCALSEAYDEAKDSWQEAQQNADIWHSRAKMATESQIQDEYYEYSRYWQSSADQYRLLSEKIAGKFRKYGDIQSYTATLFSETAGMRIELISALKELQRWVTGDGETNGYSSDWNKHYLTMIGKVIAVSPDRRQTLKKMGVTQEQISTILSSIESESDYRFLINVLDGRYASAFQMNPGDLSFFAVKGVLCFMEILAQNEQMKEIEEMTNGILWTDQTHYRNRTRSEEAAWGSTYLSVLTAVLQEELERKARLCLSGDTDAASGKQYSILLQMESYLLSVRALAFDQNEYHRITGQSVVPSDYRQKDMDEFAAKLAQRYLVGARISGLSLDENGFSYQMNYRISENGIVPDERSFWLDDEADILYVKGGTYRSMSSIDQAMSREEIQNYIDQQKKLDSVYAYQWLTKKAGDHTDSLVEDTFNYDWKKALQHGSKFISKNSVIKERVGEVPIVWADIFVHEWKYQEKWNDYQKRMKNEQTRQQVKMFGEACYYETTVGSSPYQQKQVHLTDLETFDIHVMDNMQRICQDGFESFMRKVDTANRYDIDLIVRIIEETDDLNVRYYGNALLNGRIDLLLRTQNGSKVWNAFSMIEQVYNEQVGPMEKLDMFSLLRGDYQ